MIKILKQKKIMSENNFRYVGVGKTFLSPTDFIVQVDTLAGAVTLVLPKISTILDSYTTIYQYIGIRFVDVSNNASVNNITIECFESNIVNNSSLLVLNTNGAGGIITLLGNNEWSYNANSTSGGGSAPVDILYADLYNSIVNIQLVAGQKYRLLDYRSVNFLNGWTLANQNPTPIDPSFNPRQIHTGSDEILLLEAISSYELNPVCNSEKYGGDILQFQAYTNKIGVDIGGIFNGQTLPDSSVVSGFNLQWDGSNVYFDMPTGYPALFGHYFYLFAEFSEILNYGGFVNGTFLGLSVSDDLIYLVSPLGGSGVGLSIYVANLISTPNTYTLYAISDVGSGYVIGDVLTVLGSQLGGVDGINDCTITITEIIPYIYSYYQDGVFEPLTPVIAECQYPFSNDSTYPIQMSRISVSSDGMKVVLIDLTETDYNNYDTNTLYVDTVYAIGDAYGCVTRRNDTQKNINVPFDFRSRVYRRYEVDLTSLNPAFSIGYYGQGDDYKGQGTTGLFKDLLSFGNGSNNPSYDIQWNGMGGYDMNFYAGYNDNVVVEMQFSINIFGDFTYDNTFESCFLCKIVNNFTFNTLASATEYSDIGGNFNSNLIYGFSNNKVGFGFVNNIIGLGFVNNSIGGVFINNIIGDGFFENTIGLGFVNNIIGDGFLANTIGTFFQNNNIGDDFYHNFIFTTLNNNFASNIVLNGFKYNNVEYSLGVDFSLATYVYGDYNCNIFKNSGGVITLSYVDGTNTIQYVLPTA